MYKVKANNTSDLWAQSLNWLCPLDFSVRKRLTKFIVSCSDCQQERQITYAQAWNIINSKYSRECYKCRKAKGKIKIATKHLDLYRTTIHLKQKSPRTHKQILAVVYRNIFKEKVTKEHQLLNRRRYDKEKLLNNKSLYVMKCVRNRVATFIRSKGKLRFSKKLGCSYSVFKEHIEKQFLEGMTWNNYGSKRDNWNIDHIYPLSIAWKQGPEKFLESCNYKNLRPLWAIDNILKRDRII